MNILNNITTYPFLTILTTAGKKSFENIARIANKGGDTIRRMLRPGGESLAASQALAQVLFSGKKDLLMSVDDTKINKSYSRITEGIFWLFDNKIGKCIKGYKFLVGAISDGKLTVPIEAAFSFGKEFYDDPATAREVTVQFFIKKAQSLFPQARITAVLDGAFATKKYLQWALDNNIRTEVRMHSNRVVQYKGKKIKLREIKEIRPKGRQMARTVHVIWQGLKLYVTAVRRIDKHGNETIVYQAATYTAKPMQHAQNYKKRWGIEKSFRTMKTSMGLEENYSTKIAVQYNHMCAVLFAYAITQMEMKRNRLKNAEEALRALERKKLSLLNYHIDGLDRIKSTAYA